MRYNYLPLLVASIISIIAAANSSLAQYEYRTYSMPSGMGGMFNNSISATIAANQWNRIFLCTTLKTCGSSAGQNTTSNSRATTANSPSEQSRSQPLANESALRFRSVGFHIKTRELADQLGNTQQEREQYLKLLNAVLEEFGKKVAGAGLQNDLAIALSYFFVENLRIYRGLPEATYQQFVGVRNVIAQILVAQPGVTKLTDRQKQEYYEALVAYTGATQFGYEQAKQAGNEQIAKGYQHVAGQNLQTLTKMAPESFGNAGGGSVSIVSPFVSDRSEILLKQ